MSLEFNKKLSPKRRKKLKDNSKTIKGNSFDKGLKDNETKELRKLPSLLFPYQSQFLSAFYSNKHRIMVWEKSRRIGATHGLAALAVLEASRERGSNFYYIGTNLSMSKEFIDSCAYWARHFQFIGLKVEEEFYDDEDKDILSLRIKFKSGKKIAALSSKPSSVRGLQGHVLLDEAAFVNDMDAFIKAMKALLLWGSKLFIVSTHDGINNPFNMLVEKIKKGELNYYLQRTTFKEAVKEGFYKRRCLMLGIKYVKKEEEEWVTKTYEDVGDDASEELDVNPSEEQVNNIFKKSYFNFIQKSSLPAYYDYQVLAWDTAATEKTKSCYTVAVRLAKAADRYYLLDWKYIKGNPLTTQEFIIQVCKTCDKDTPVFVELEGGSQSRLWFENTLRPNLPGYKIVAVRPKGSKLVRSVPVGEKAREGKFYLVDNKQSEEFLNIINSFDGTPGIPLITDTGDALSLAFQQLEKGIQGLILGGVVKPRNTNFGRFRRT